MAKTITVSDEVYSILQGNAQKRGVPLNILAEKLISEGIEKNTTSWYQMFRRNMLKEKPELANRTKEEIIKNFDQLSNKIAAGIHFETLEEMEQFIRL
jgi:hypothetical protein